MSFGVSGRGIAEMMNHGLATVEETKETVVGRRDLFRLNDEN